MAPAGPGTRTGKTRNETAVTRFGRAIIADAAPQARYVRAFNSLGWENFADPMPGTKLLPLWFALVQQNGGNRRVALRIITEG